MTTIQLTNSEITTLRCTTNQILIPEYKIAIHTPHTFGAIPQNYVILNISNEESNSLFDGQHVVSNGFILYPKDAITPRFSKDQKALTIHKSFKFTKTKLSASQLLELIFESYYIKLQSHKGLQHLLTYDYIENKPIIVVFDAKNNVVVKLLQYQNKNDQSKLNAKKIQTLVDDFINPK